MNRRIVLRLIRKELIQTRRDRRLLRMIFVASVMQLFVFGYGVSTDVNHISMAVLDEDRTAPSRAAIDHFVRSGYFLYSHSLSHPAEIDRLLDAGKAQMVLRIPRGYAGDLSRGRAAEIQTILDGSDSMTAGIIAGYANGVVRSYSDRVTAARLDRLRTSVPRLPAVELRERVWYNPELASVNFMVPGVLSSILLIVTMMMTSLAIVKEREIGTLEQLIVTPIRPIELMIGKTVPFLLIGLLDTVLILLVAAFWFHVPIRGSLPLLFGMTVIYLVSSLGLGLFISTISKTQQEATLTGFFFMLPAILLSGLMFPVENMPRVIQWITYAIPLRYYLTIIRGIFLKGSGIEQLWPQALILLAFGAVILTLSARRFSKRLG